MKLKNIFDNIKKGKKENHNVDSQTINKEAIDVQQDSQNITGNVKEIKEGTTIPKAVVINFVRNHKIANGEKVRPDYPATEEEMVDAIAYSLQHMDELMASTKEDDNVM